MKELILTPDMFVDWFDNIVNDTVKRYKFDKYLDINLIMNMRDKAKKDDGEDNTKITLYWAGRSTGTILKDNLDVFLDAVSVLNLKVKFKLDFDFDDSNNNPFCVVTEL